MADKEISNLPELEAVTDETMLPAYQPGAQNPAQRISGAQFREFAQAAVGEHTAAAQQAAQTAQTAAGQAQNAAGAAANQAANQAVAEVQNQLQGLVRDVQSAAGQSATQADRAEAAAKRAEAAADRAASEIVNTASGEVVAVNDSATRGLRGLTLYGKTTQNGTPTPDAPVHLKSVGEDGSVAVTVSGKNLVDLLNPAYKLANQLTGLTVNETVNSVSFSGTTNGTWATSRYMWFLPKGTYTLSAKMETDKGFLLLSVYAATRLDGNYTILRSISASGSTTFTIDEACYVELRHHFTGTTGTNGETWTTRYYDIQIEKGSTTTAYEPYKPAQTLTVHTPNGLPGISVSSGGNYTDENGQQWICDEIDFARGKYVQRICTIILSGTENWIQNSSSTFFNLIRPARDAMKGSAICDMAVPTQSSNGLTTTGVRPSSGGECLAFFFKDNVQPTLEEWKNMLANRNSVAQYILLAPTETDLSAEELAQYAALHTNYHNTTVLNDSGAGMGVSYVADTKLYIDNKFAQLAAAMLNS